MMQIAIVLYPGVTALDFVGPYEMLRHLPGARVTFVGHTVGPVATDSGVLLVGTTHTFSEIPSTDLVLVPGGPGALAAARDEAMLDWLRAVHPSATWTASVCTGSLILAAAGLLASRRATSHWSALSALKTFGVTPVADERIVVHDDVVTAAGVSAGLDLALWLAARIAGDDRAKTIQLVNEYDPQPPFDSGHLTKASARTQAGATALLAKDVCKPAALQAATLLLWDQAMRRVRTKLSR